jgi:hypothetical protein
MKTKLIAILFIFISFSVSAQTKIDTITNAKIIKLTKIGLQPSEIINKIKTSVRIFDLSEAGISKLNENNVSQEVINEMLKNKKDDMEVKTPIINDKTEEVNSSQDVVSLKNGSIIRGSIIEIIPDKTIKIETADRNLFVFQMSEVAKITKETNPINTDKMQEQIEQIAGYVAVISKSVAEKKDDNIDSKWKPKPFGIGVDLIGMLTPDYSVSSYQLYAPAVVFFSYTPLKYLRIESEFALAFASGGDKNFYIAIGALGMWQTRNVNFYAGLKFPYFYNSEIIYIMPAIGGEYIFAKRFSLGAEIGLPIGFKKDAAAAQVGFNRVIFRFYLGGKEKN